MNTMSDLRVSLLTHAKLLVECDDGEAWGLREHFSFFVPGYKWMPKYRSGMWDGKIRIFDYNRRHLPAGLFDELMKYAESHGLEVELVESAYGCPGNKNNVDPREVMDFIEGLNLSSRGERIEVRDYQFNAVCKAIQDKRILLLSPTASGKSLIIYILLRWWMEKRDDKFLVVVPTTSLVEQMYSDFEDYSTFDQDWKAKDELHKIYSGKEKTNVHERVFISTWQSIYKLPRTWFEQFGTIFGDEAHGFTANSLTKSMEKATRAENRVGTTGTLDGTKTNELVLRGVFGPVVKFVSTKNLQDRGTLSDLKIKVIDLQYPEDVKRSFGKVSYQAEIDWIVRNESRNKFITNLATSLDGNTLVLFQFVEKHGKILYDMIKEKSKYRTFFVAGEVDKNDREAIRNIIESQKKSCTVASLGTFSTGVNIRNLHNLLLVTPAKKQIRILQSIGRSLRKADNGQLATMYDFVDHLTDGAKPNYSKQHGEERIKIYDREEFNYKRYEVNLR